MKFRTRSKDKVKKQPVSLRTRGPKPVVSKNGATRFPFWLPDPLRQRVTTANKRAERAGIKTVTLAKVFRKGGEMFLDDFEEQISSALKNKPKKRKETE
jgi:hypothetical protein